MQIKLDIDFNNIEVDGEYYETLQNVIQQEITMELRKQVREKLQHNKEVRALSDKIGGIIIAELTLAAEKPEESNE